MPWLILPLGGYVYGKFFDTDEIIPWTRITIMVVVLGFVFYVYKKGRG